MFFLSYEEMQITPILFQWQHETKTINIPHEDFLYMGELITGEGNYNKKMFVLTKYFLFECTDLTFKNPINSLASLEIRNPSVKKVEEKDL
jgi:hypothetical protein